MKVTNQMMGTMMSRRRMTSTLVENKNAMMGTTLVMNMCGRFTLLPRAAGSRSP